MSLSLTSPISALGLGSFVNIAATGGVTPYTYALAENGAGGSLISLQDGSVTYSAPVQLTAYDNCVDKIIVTDAEENTASLDLVVGDYLTIFCDIIAHELNIPGRVFFFNEKVEWPKDNKLFVSVGILTNHLMSNTTEYKSINNIYCEVKTVNSRSVLSVDLYSRGTDALTRQDEVFAALVSTYSKNQQTRNGIKIAQIPSGNSIRNLSELDGSAMLFRFNFDVVVYHTKTLIKEVDYFDSFQIAEKINA